MFERFTDRARFAVVNSQEEARMLQHSYIGTEHVLLGLLNDDESLAGKALNRLGVTLVGTRRGVEQLIGRGDRSPSGHIPFSPRAKKVLELSLREALGLGHNYIGTEHIVLGILREGEGVASQLMVEQGVTPDQVRAAVLAEIAESAATRAGAPATSGPRSRSSSTASSASSAPPRRTPGADAIIAAAQELAGDAPMGSHHLLEAMALLEGSLAGNTLAALGLDTEALTAKIDELGIEGTSDVTPEVAAARRTELRLGDEAVTLSFGDESIRALATILTESLGNPVRGADAAGGAFVGLWQAVHDALQALVAKVAPPPPDEPADDAGRTAIVRAAIRNRLRRRNP